MTIRFTCVECGSVLKIKAELAGTAGRCPKCKTKFIVPAPDGEEPRADAESTNHGDSHPESIDLLHSKEPPEADPLPIEHPHEDISAPLVPAEANSLHLDDSNSDDDSDTDIDAYPPQNSDHEQHHETVPEHSTAAADVSDDDLDSPPIMVSSVMHASHSESIPVESGKREKTSQLPEIDVKSPKPKPKASGTKPFDPMDFLMSDRPAASRTSPVSERTSSDAPDLSLSMDSNDDFQTRSTPIPLTRPTPRPSSSHFTPEKVDLATQAKLMKKAIKDSQSESAHQRDVDAKSGYDYGLFFREFGWRGVVILVGGIVMTFGLYIGANWMFSSSLRLPKLGRVTGTIKLDGQPLPGAEVYFAPLEVELPGWKKDRVRTSIGVTDAKGQYKMMYVLSDKIEGVAVGRCRMWISHIGPKGNDIPSEWSEGAMLVKEITEGNQKASFDVDLTSTKKR